uniref:Methionine aminopeptidase n=1 Tax=Rhizochromulina marina TaxID=1034831 RepID=A0A7S2WP08_9STRA|mmetsp:Transcript_28992/g.84634  ORF Transcript_28992/g.84634 Transcript_28992/m.84634 type:complete len:305 (+) Transcript_28992:3-917(+)
MLRSALRGRSFFSWGSARSMRTVPSTIVHPPYAATGQVPACPPYVVLQTEEGLHKLRKAGQLAREMLELTCSLAVPGKTTDEIDAEVHEAIVARGAYPAPLNYRGFPKSVCSSINREVCHGIPSSRPLEEGDIAKFDVSVYFDGHFGDNCATVCVGEVDAEGQRLVTASREAILAALPYCVPGGCLSNIGRAIHEVADKYGYQSVEQYGGHGIGAHFHMPPFVQHFRNSDHLDLVPGLVFTIEPMIVEGSKHCHLDPGDGWTVLTKDSGRAAQFEHMVAITEDGHEVLTRGKTEEEGNSIALGF